MKCSFCGKGIKKGTGLLFVMLSGRSANYCSSKCRKNVALGRKQRKVKWTNQYISEKKARIKRR